MPVTEIELYEVQHDAQIVVSLHFVSFWTVEEKIVPQNCFTLCVFQFSKYLRMVTAKTCSASPSPSLHHLSSYACAAVSLLHCSCSDFMFVLC